MSPVGAVICRECSRQKNNAVPRRKAQSNSSSSNSSCSSKPGLTVELRSAMGSGASAQQLQQKISIIRVGGRVSLQDCGILSICSSVQERLRWARELFRSSPLARFAIIWGSPRYRRLPGCICTAQKAPVSSPTSAINAPSLAHICGDVALSCLDGFTKRMLLSKKGSSRTRHS